MSHKMNLCEKLIAFLVMFNRLEKYSLKLGKYQRNEIFTTTKKSHIILNVKCYFVTELRSIGSVN